MSFLKQENLWSHIVQNLPDLVFIKDMNGIYQEINAEFENFMGKSRDQIVGKDDFDFFDMDKAEHIRAMDQEILRSKTPQLLEETIKDANGKTAFFFTKKAPFLDEETGAIIGIIGIARDITAQKELSFLLREKNTTFSNTINGMSEGWALHEMVWDDDGRAVDYRFLDMNPAFEKMLNLSKADLVGASVLQVLPQTEPYWVDAFAQVVLTGKAKRFEQYSKSFDKTFEVYAMPSGQNQFAVMVSDITERKRFEYHMLMAKRQAEEMAQAKDRFISNMSHEMRTPIHSILGLSQLIQSAKHAQEMIEYAKHIRESGEHLMGIIEDLLHYATLTSGEIDDKANALNVRLLIEEMRGMYDYLAKAKHLSLAIAVHPRVPEWVGTQRLMVRQVITHLLSNALKFTDRGKVTLEMDALGENLIIRVSDTGIGMDHVTQERIYELFYQADDTKSKKYQGMGLGLTLVKEMVQGLGGEIAVESTLGVGSVFKVDIPVKKLDLGGTSSQKNSGDNVLLIEDDDVSRMMIEKILKKLDIHIYLAENQEEALHWMDKRAIKMVIANLNMPCFENKDALAAYKKMTLSPLCVVGIVDDLKKITPVVHTLDAIIEKPIHHEKLNALMREWLFKT